MPLLSRLDFFAAISFISFISKIEITRTSTQIHPPLVRTSWSVCATWLTGYLISLSFQYKFQCIELQCSDYDLIQVRAIHISSNGENAPFIEEQYWESYRRIELRFTPSRTILLILDKGFLQTLWRCELLFSHRPIFLVQHILEAPWPPEVLVLRLYEQSLYINIFRFVRFNDITEFLE